MQIPNQTLLQYRRFLMLLIAVSIISATAPVFGIEKSEDYTIFVSGFEAYQHKDYVGALQYFNSLLVKFPDTPLLDVTMFWTSRAYYKTGNKMESARYMSRLMKQYPDTSIRGFVEDEIFELVSRFERGEQLPTKTAQAGISRVSSYSSKIAALETSKAALSAPTSRDYNFTSLTPDPKRSKSAPTDTGIRRAASTDSAKKQLKQTATVATQAIGATLVKDIKTGASYIDIVTGSSLKGFKTFKLLHPGRLVIDLPHAKSALAAKSISINRLGISKVRIGNDRDTVRIVMDIAKSPFPAYNVKPFENGLRISVAPSAALMTAAYSGQTSTRSSTIKQKFPVTTPTKNAVFIKRISTGASYIDIVTGSSLESYNSFILRHPGRLVIDIPGAKSAVSSKSVSIERKGISKVRIGINGSSVRIVLDAAQSQLPAYEIRPTKNGLRINLGVTADVACNLSKFCNG